MEENDKKNTGINPKVRIKLGRHTSYQRKRRIGGKGEKIKGLGDERGQEEQEIGETEAIHNNSSNKGCKQRVLSK